LRRQRSGRRHAVAASPLEALLTHPRPALQGAGRPPGARGCRAHMYGNPRSTGCSAAAAPLLGAAVTEGGQGVAQTEHRPVRLHVAYATGQSSWQFTSTRVCQPLPGYI
jgi:hypothetical protein